MKICKNSDKDRDLYSKFISNFFLSLMMFTVLKRLLPSSNLGIIMSGAVSFTHTFVVLIQIMLKSKLKIKYSFIIFFVLIVTILYLISYLNGVPLEKIIFYYLFTLLGLFLMYITYCIKDLNILYDDFSKISLLIFLFSLLIVFVNKIDNSYNMRYSYILSIALYFHTIDFFKFKKIKNIIIILIEFLLILFYGSRGPLLCYTIFFLAFIMFENKKTSIKLLFSFIIAYFILNINNILLLISNLVDKLNISSRTLYLLINDFKHSSGRDLINVKVIEIIKDHLTVGVGIAGEFKYMNDYPHNIFLDLILHWGIIFGSIFIGMIICIITKALLLAKEKERYVLLVFISYGLIALLFSGTYLSWDGFYILMGICLRIIFNKRKVKYE